MSGTRNRDFDAGELLEELRRSRGISRERLPYEMLRAGVERDYIPSVKTIYNVEVRGVVPRVRIQFGLAQFFGREVKAIWPVKRRARVPA